MKSTPPRRAFGLVQQKLCWVPTTRAWMLAAAIAVAGALVVLFGAYPFFAQVAPFPDGPVIVEGWAGDSCLRAAIAEYHRREYPVLIFTGGPIEEDSLFKSYGTFAQLGVANAERLGFPRDKAQAVPAPEVKKDRTYAAAVAARQWLAARGRLPPHVTIITSGTHGRRSRELFQRAFGDETKVGVLAIRDTGFNPDRWWTSSSGFRSVTAEIIAYSYTKLFFWRGEE